MVFDYLSQNFEHFDIPQALSFKHKFQCEFPGNFQERIEQLFPEIPKKRTTSRGKPNFFVFAWNRGKKSKSLQSF